MNGLQADVTLSTECQRGRHDVVYRVSAWGHVYSVFSPCDEVPRKLLPQSLGRCKSLVADVRKLLQGIGLQQELDKWWAKALSDVNGIDLDARGELRAYISHIRESGQEIAKQQLRDTQEATLVQAMKTGRAGESWAAALLAAQVEKPSRKLLGGLRSLHSVTQPVTRAIALVKLSQDRSVDSKRCIEEALQNFDVASFIREAIIQTTG